MTYDQFVDYEKKQLKKAFDHAIRDEMEILYEKETAAALATI